MNNSKTLGSEPRAGGNVDLFMRELLGDAGSRTDHYKYGAKVYKYERGLSLRRRDREDSVPFADSSPSVLSRIMSTAHAVLGDNKFRVCLYCRDLCVIATEDQESDTPFSLYQLNTKTIEDGSHGVYERGGYAVIVTHNEDKTDVFVCNSVEDFKRHNYIWKATIAEGFGSGYEIEYDDE
jgi:hypothetical protein